MLPQKVVNCLLYARVNHSVVEGEIYYENLGYRVRLVLVRRLLGALGYVYLQCDICV